MTYRQISTEERYTIASKRTQGCKSRSIATAFGRHHSSISREFARNRCSDECYRLSKADRRTRTRRSISHRDTRFTIDDIHLVEVGKLPDRTAAELKRRTARLI